MDELFDDIDKKRSGFEETEEDVQTADHSGTVRDTEPGKDLFMTENLDMGNEDPDEEELGIISADEEFETDKKGRKTVRDRMGKQIKRFRLWMRRIPCPDWWRYIQEHVGPLVSVLFLAVLVTAGFTFMAMRNCSRIPR